MGETEKAGAVWVKMLASWAATGTTGRTPVHAARIGTTPHRTRTITSGRGSSVSTPLYRFANATALQADQSKCGQPDLSSFGEYTSGFGRTPSRKSNGGADFMPKRHRHLIDRIVTIDNLRDAYRKTAKNKRMTWGYLEFKEYAESNLLLVQQELADGAYKIGGYREFTIYEPKPRLISALDFKDRLVQHALCNVIGPIFEKTLMPYTFACRVGMGTHAGVRHIQSRMRSSHASHFLKTDFSKFFPSVDHAVLHDMIDRKIGCEKTLKILREIISVDGIGIPIGSLTSQLFANVYGNPLDRFIHFDLGHHNWARYMDDIVILDKDPARLRDSFQAISEFSHKNLRLKISKWSVGPLSQGVNFLGYRIWHDHKLLRKDSVVRAKRKVARFVKHNDTESLNKFIASWSGHAQWANTNNLFNWMENKYGFAF
jgi:retron-type reverse transcriptase